MNKNLFTEVSRLQRQQTDSKRHISIVQHEAAQLLCLPQNADSALIVENIKVRLGNLQSELRETHFTESQEKKARLNLSKKVGEQTKLIANQDEEIRLAKDELSAAREKILELEAMLTLEKNSAAMVTEELIHVRTLIADAETKARTLETENASLVERILTEKRKTADDMNEMNSIVEGQSSHYLQSIRNQNIHFSIAQLCRCKGVNRGGHQLPQEQSKEFPRARSRSECESGTV